MYELWGHQAKARAMAKDKDNFALFFEAGSGKTGTAINILRDKYAKHNGILNTLIFCPPIVIENWRREFAKFSKVEDSNICCLIGSGTNRVKLFNNSGAKIFITNYEALSVASMKPLINAIHEWGPTCLIFDESHRIKDMKSKRTKAAITLSDLAKYTLLLTGTPILNSLMDIFAQFRALDGGESFGKNFFSFRGSYFYDASQGMPRDRYFPNWKPREDSSAVIHEKISLKSMHITKEECLDLPPLVKKTIYVPMSKQQTKLYNEMKQDFIAFINDKACVAQLAITKALRLQQIVTGFIPVEEGGGERAIIKIKDNPRAVALKELLEDLTPKHKVLVWAVFKENYKTIKDVCEILKLDYVEVNGSVSAAEKLANVDKFNTDSNCRVLIGHPGSGGIGINLVAASYSIFFSRSFSLEYDIQAEARNHRAGSEVHTKITRIDLVSPGTIDELVLESLSAKQAISVEVLKGIEEEV